MASCNDLPSYLELSSIKFVMSFCRPFRTFLFSACQHQAYTRLHAKFFDAQAVSIILGPPWTRRLCRPRKDALVWSKAGAERWSNSIMFLCILCGVSENIRPKDMTCIVRDDFRTKPGDSACNPLQRCDLNSSECPRRCMKHSGLVVRSWNTSAKRIQTVVFGGHVSSRAL